MLRSETKRREQVERNLDQLLRKLTTPKSTAPAPGQKVLFALIVGLLAAYVAVRLVVPTVLRLLRPALFLVAVLIAVRLLYPTQVCSIELVANLPYVCAR